MARVVRGAAYLLAHQSFPMLAAGGLALCAAAGPGAAVLVGGPLLLLYLVIAVLTAAVPRRMVGLLGRAPVPDPRRSMLDGSRRPRGGLRDEATRREAAYAGLSLLSAPIQFVLLFGWIVLTPALLAAPLLAGGGDEVVVGPAVLESTGDAWIGFLAGIATLVAGGLAVPAAARAQARLAASLLGPPAAELAVQIADLRRSRLRLINAFDVERRRIERDLHDGVQQHLAALAMTLDLARIELENEPDSPVAPLVEKAYQLTTRTMDDLRSLINDITPPTLIELGLPAAVEQLASSLPIDVRLAIDLPERPPSSIESTAYFVVSEALSNAAKHSAATRIDVAIEVRGQTLHLDVADNGVGGADPARGTGLAGLGDRVAAVGGSLALSSPVGGPTRMHASLPLHGPEQLA